MAGRARPDRAHARRADGSRPVRRAAAGAVSADEAAQGRAIADHGERRPVVRVRVPLAQLA